MKPRLPSFDTICTALDGELPPMWLQKLSHGYYCWNYLFASEAHNIPEWFTVLTLREFVSARVDLFVGILDQAWVSLVESKAHTLINIIRKNADKIIPLIPSIWQDRFQTATLMYRSFSDEIHYIDMPKRFRNPWIDYTQIFDGWAQVIVPIQETPYSTLPWSDYLQDKWWQHTIHNLESHIVMRAKIPDSDLRRKYLSSLGVLGFLMNNLKHSIWAPREMKPNSARWEHKWIGEVASYPANGTIEFWRVILLPTPAVS